MKPIKIWELPGKEVPAPYGRIIRSILGPDINNIRELLCCQALIHPFSQTELHTHDRAELIYIVGGRGEIVYGEERFPLESDMLVWAEPGVEHQIINKDAETLKLMAVFVPAVTAEENMRRALGAVSPVGK